MRAGQISVSPSRWQAIDGCPWQVYLRDVKKIPPHETDRFTLPGRTAHFTNFQLYSIMKKNPTRFKDVIFGGNAGVVLNRLYLSLIPSHLQNGYTNIAINFSLTEARRLKRILEVVPRSEAWGYFIPAQLETRHVIQENYIIFINDFSLLYPARYFDCDEIPKKLRNDGDEYAIGDYKPGNPEKESKWKVDGVKKQINFEAAFIDTLPKPARYGRVYFYRSGEEVVFPTSDRSIENIRQKVPIMRKMLDMAQDRHELKIAIKNGLDMEIDPEDEAIFRNYWCKKPSKFTCGWCGVRQHCLRKQTISNLIASTIRDDISDEGKTPQIETNDDTLISSPEG